MGLKIANQPCVWCGGKNCTNLDDALCEPADFMLRGQALGVWRYGVPLISLEHAVCPLNLSIPQAPAATTPAPDWGCLNPYVSPTDPHAGCNAITNRAVCLTSRDGRSASELSGLKIANQPCVWCGGRPCTNHGDALCEPEDFMLRGKALGVWTVGVSVSSLNLQHALCHR